MTSPSSPAAASPSPSHLSQPSPTASTPPYHGHGHGQPAASRPTGVLGNIGASPGTSSSSPHTESTPQTAAQRAAMAALVGRIRGMEAECVALSKRLAGAEALRTRASLRIVHPQEGDVWYAGQACSITWVSHGAVRNLSVRIGSYVGSYVSSWQVIRDDIADTGNVTLALPHDTPTGWYCLRLSGSQVCTSCCVPAMNYGAQPVCAPDRESYAPDWIEEHTPDSESYTPDLES